MTTPAISGILLKIRHYFARSVFMLMPTKCDGSANTFNRYVMSKKFVWGMTWPKPISEVETRSLLLRAVFLAEENIRLKKRMHDVEHRLMTGAKVENEQAMRDLLAVLAPPKKRRRIKT